MVACCAMADTELYPRPLPDLTEDDRPDVSLVVPVFNEERTIQEVVEQAVAVLEGDSRTFEVIVVDDGSRDGTWAAIERLHAGDGRIKAVRFKRNFGQHPAMHAGLVRARGDIIVTMDGDLQNQPSDLPKLIAAAVVLPPLVLVVDRHWPLARVPQILPAGGALNWPLGRPKRVMLATLATLDVSPPAAARAAKTPGAAHSRPS